MKIAKCLSLVVVLLVATAYASPIFGTWKGELNGKPITITLNSTKSQFDGRFAVAETSPARITNARFSNEGKVVRFQVPNQNGGMKLVSSGPEQLTFELELTGTDQAVLHSVDEPNAPGIKMTRVAKPDAR
jgi:hypothetical protein